MHPCRVQVLQPGQQWTFAKSDSFSVQLNQDNTLDVPGSWTVVYDQGLVIEFHDAKFYANFMYTVKAGVEDFSQLKTSDLDKF